jgi:glycosyltransferase involved in cell wall biosynthesis
VRDLRARLGSAARPEGPRRIYLTRKDWQHRKLVNRPEVESWLARRGFEILDFEKLSFQEQIAKIRAADIILGASGSSFFTCFFARPGTVVGELSHHFLHDFEWYAAIFGALGLDYWVICGDVQREDASYRTFSDYCVETDTLSRFLSSRQVNVTPESAAGTIMALLGVKDEVELIEAAIENLRVIGVDAIGVADLGSTDGTLEILRRLDQQEVITLVQYDSQDDAFRSAAAPQFQSLIEKYKPDWIMLSDADERWIPERGSIRETINNHDADILVVNRFNVPLTDATATLAQDIGVPSGVDFDIAIDGPLVSEELFLRDPGCRWSLAVDAPRVMFRADAATGWDGGQHAVTPSTGRRLTVKIASDVFVAHLPITSETRFAAKLANVSRYLKRRVGRADQGRPWHWRRWAEIYDNGLTRGEYLAAFAGRPCLPHLAWHAPRSPTVTLASTGSALAASTRRWAPSGKPSEPSPGRRSSISISPGHWRSRADAGTRFPRRERP